MALEHNISVKQELENSSVLPVQYFRSGTDTLIFLIFSVLLALVIVFGNIVIMAAFKHCQKLRRRSNMFIISLACSDCLVGIVSLPLWISISGLGVGKGEVLYAFFISFDIFSALTSVFHLTAISVERYISVSRPFLYNRLSMHYYIGTIATASVDCGDSYCCLKSAASIVQTPALFRTCFHHYWLSWAVDNHQCNVHWNISHCVIA